MPKGLAILEWTMEDGLVLIKKYPESLKINIDDMMGAFYAHITGAGAKGNVIVRLESAQVSISSYFTGMESKVPYMINLILDLGEDPEMFSSSISEINQNILNFLNKMNEDASKKLNLLQELEKYLENMFDFLQRLINPSKEQKIAQIYCSPKGQQILARLQEGPISKKELKSYLEKNYKQMVSNLEALIDPFTETGILKEDWIKGHKDQYLFLMNDISIIRGPATQTIESAKQNKPTSIVAKTYLNQVEEFFSKYKPSPEDNLKIASILIHPDKYDVLRLFTYNYYNYKKIPKGSEVGGEETRKIINQLIEEKILTKINEGQSEWVMLLSEIDVNIFFPEYLLEKIRKDFNQGKIKEEVAVKHLEILEKVYGK